MSHLRIIAIICAAIACISSSKMSAFCTIIQNTDKNGPTLSTSNNSTLYFQPTSVVYKQDDGIIRLKGNLVGRPHTSNRIDGASLTINNIDYQAVDIDGIDFKRYFQWDDEGLIPLEIDFKLPKGKRLPKVTSKSIITLKTIHGDFQFKAAK